MLGCQRFALVSAIKEPAAIRPPRSLSGLQVVQVIGGALRMGGGRENGALVFFEDAQPVVEVGSMVFPHFRRDAENGAKESRSQFGNSSRA
jgi:hypothetical protein